jgi:cell division protein ZapA (FtsZ GTPase activity inhibitor)
MQTIKVKILGHEYSISSDGDLELVHAIEEYLNGKLGEIMDASEGLSQNKAAILAALYIAGDYIQLKKKYDALSSRVRERTDALIHQIDAMVS